MSSKEENITFENEQGQMLKGILHIPPKKTHKALICCHGFGSSKKFALLWHLADRASRLGIAALRFDFTGCGDSQGDFSLSTYTQQVSDLQSAIAMMRAQGYTEFALCGHSMGGAVSILAASRDRLIKALIDLCAPSHPNKDMIKKFGIKKEDGTYSVSLGKKVYTLDKKFVDDLEQVQVDDAVRKLKIPLLFVHGTADTLVPYEQSEHLHHLCPSDDKTLEPIQGADHLFTGKHEDIAELVSNWLHRRI